LWFCNTSHIIAAINAIEDAYRMANIEISISKKADAVREFALNAEKIQNHIKWLYFSILPEIFHLNGEDEQSIKAFEGKEWIKAQKICNEVLKAMAIFTGQWPHGSFCMVGGVTCDPTKGDVFEALRYLDIVTKFCEEEIFGETIENFLKFDTSIQIMGTKGTLQKTVEVLVSEKFDQIGKSYDRFITLGNNNQKHSAKKSQGTSVMNANLKFVSESLAHSFFVENGYTYSKSAMYKNRYMESGPIARMMIAKDPLIRDLHRRNKDSVLTRVVAKIAEIAHLLQDSKKLLQNIDLNEPSCNFPQVNTKEISAIGIGRCEAARGSLWHRVEIQNGLIKHYDIITPTVWNLGNGDKNEPSVAQKALIGLDTVDKANFVFKAFDVCAVCTTQ